MTQPSPQLMSVLCCPFCGGPLAPTMNGVFCERCATSYEYTDSGSLDLRLKRRKSYRLDFDLGTPLLPASEVHFKPLVVNSRPEVDYSKSSIPRHLTKELLSYFPQARDAGSLMLDFGCGSAIHKAVCEYAGFEYVGLDYSSPRAQILGDAHSLPFKESSFEFILSIAVMEHIRFPFVMMREAHRVLKDNGKFIGSVAFLEPFHADSFYHHTHLGIYNMLQFGGFTIEVIAPSADWNVLRAQTSALFPKMRGILSRSLMLPLQVLHRFWWKTMLHGTDDSIRVRNTTGAFLFVASK
jgi:SAM-dependent methyltransferase